MTGSLLGQVVRQDQRPKEAQAMYIGGGLLVLILIIILLVLIF
jgi:hypothetical protein